MSRLFVARCPCPKRITVTVRGYKSTSPGSCRDGPNSKRLPVKHAVRKFSQAAHAPAHSARSSLTSSATIIPLSAISGGGAVDRPGVATAAPPAPAARRGSRGGDLIFGGLLALILLIACLTWEVLSDREVPHASLQDQSAFAPAAR